MKSLTHAEWRAQRAAELAIIQACIDWVADSGGCHFCAPMWDHTDSVVLYHGDECPLGAYLNVKAGIEARQQPEPSPLQMAAEEVAGDLARWAKLFSDAAPVYAIAMGAASDQLRDALAQRRAWEKERR